MEKELGTLCWEFDKIFWRKTRIINGEVADKVIDENGVCTERNEKQQINYFR